MNTFSNSRKQHPFPPLIFPPFNKKATEGKKKF